MRTYRLARPFVWFLRLGAGFVLVVVVASVADIFTNPVEPGATIFLIAWLVYAGALATLAVRTIPHHVTISADGMVRFSMVGRSVDRKSVV